MRRIRRSSAPVDIYEESDMIIRTIRDIFTADVDAIYVDEPPGIRAGQGVPADRHAALRQSTAAVRGQRTAVPQVQARGGNRADPQAAKCRCTDGGSLVIDQTEALVAIDVNSGNFRATIRPKKPPSRSTWRPPTKSPASSGSATWAA